MAGIANKLKDNRPLFTVEEIMEQWAMNYGLDVAAPAMTMLVGLVKTTISAEREECAKIADDYAEQARRERWTGAEIGNRTASAVAAMIRKRK